MISVVGEENQNQFDQRYIEYELERLSAGQIQIVRLTLTQCAKRWRKIINRVTKINTFENGYF